MWCKPQKIQKGWGVVLLPVLASCLPTPCFPPKGIFLWLRRPIQDRFPSFYFYTKEYNTQKNNISYTPFCTLLFSLIYLEIVSYQSVKCFLNLLNSAKYIIM